MRSENPEIAEVDRPEIDVAQDVLPCACILTSSVRSSRAILLRRYVSTSEQSYASFSRGMCL